MTNYSSDPNMMRVGIKTGPNVAWAKELCLWNSRQGITLILRVEGRNSPRKNFDFSRSQGDTIVFRKPKAFGIWYDMYHINPSEFWELFGGKSILFVWLVDTLRPG